MKLKYLLIAIATLISVQATIAQDANGRYYSAGEIQSNAEFQYGRFEMSMYSSDVSGTTSTFFMWKNGGQTANVRWNELDIETFGKDPSSWQSNPIWEYDDTDTDIKRWEGIHTGVPVANTWVTFTLEWTPDYIAWFNNGTEVRRILAGEDVPPSHWRYNNGNSLDPVDNIADPMRISFNHWATFPGDWLGPFNPADLPSYQFVDWLTYQPWNGTGFDDVEVRMDFNNLAEVQNDFYISTHTFGDNQCTFTADNVGVTDGYLWLSITGYQDARAPQGEEIPGGGVVVEPNVHEVAGSIQAEDYSTQSGLQLEDVDPGEGTGQNLGYTDAGDYVEYEIDVAFAGTYEIDFRVASEPGNAAFSLSADNSTLLNSVAVATTGGWQVWTTITEVVTLVEGRQTLRLDVLEPGFNLYKMDIRVGGLTTATEALGTTDWNLYPNPTSTMAYLNRSANWMLVDALGTIVKQGSGTDIEIANLDNGMYFVQVADQSFRLVKQ